MEKWLVVGIIICVLSQQFFIVNTKSNNISNELIDYKMTNLDFSHNVLGEFGTNTSDICKYLRTTLKAIYYENPFYYISMVCDKNVHAYQRAEGELGLIEYPTLFFDGGYSNVVGCGNYSEYNESVFYCGNRAKPPLAKVLNNILYIYVLIRVKTYLGCE